MLYADYARRKMHNVVKLDTKEGYPLTVYSCANKKLKDYTIYGNTGGVGDKFEPYNKYKIPITVTGKNLFDISKSDGFTSQYTGLTNTITDNVITVSSTVNRIGYLTLGTFEAGTYYIGMTSEDYTDIKLIIVNDVNSKISVNNLITISERSVIKIMISMGAGTTWHFTNIQITKSNVATSYEPYHEPVITNIYRDAPLADGESINYKSDSLPDIKLEKGTNIITANTEVKPSNIKIKYLKK